MQYWISTYTFCKWGLLLCFLLANTAVHAQDRDCIDFQNWEDAQRFYQLHGYADPHNLDRDQDGVACEALKLVGVWDIKSICQGRDIVAVGSIWYSGGFSYGAQIRNNMGEVSKTHIQIQNGVVAVSSRWNDGSTTSARGRLDRAWSTIRGRDSLGCEFIAYKR